MSIAVAGITDTAWDETGSRCCYYLKPARFVRQRSIISWAPRWRI